AWVIQPNESTRFPAGSNRRAESGAPSPKVWNTYMRKKPPGASIVPAGTTTKGCVSSLSSSFHPEMSAVAVPELVSSTQSPTGSPLDSTSLMTRCALPVQVTVSDWLSPQSPSLMASVTLTLPPLVHVNVGFGVLAL